VKPTAFEFVPHCALFGPEQVATIMCARRSAQCRFFGRLFCDFEIELQGEATVPKQGKVKAPISPGLGLDSMPEVLQPFRV
jgi:hypothetical protein